MNSSDPGKGTRPHRSGGQTFKSRRTKMAMEREANKPKQRRPKPEMKATISEIFNGLQNP